MILHEIFRVVSRFPLNISCYIAENRFPLWDRVSFPSFPPELGKSLSLSHVHKLSLNLCGYFGSHAVITKIKIKRCKMIMDFFPLWSVVYFILHFCLSSQIVLESPFLHFWGFYQVAYI